MSSHRNTIDKHCPVSQNRQTTAEAGQSFLNVVVLGLGNILLSDEGAGVKAIEAMRHRYDVPETVEIIDGGTMGLDAFL